MTVETPAEKKLREEKEELQRQLNAALARQQQPQNSGSGAWQTIKDIFSFDFGGMIGSIFSGLLWVGVFTGIYFLAREYKDQIGEFFGNKEGVNNFFAKGDEMIASLADKLGFGFDVTQPLLAKSEDDFRKTIGGEKNENMSPEMVEVLTKHRQVFLPIAAEANGGKASGSQLTNDKTIFALLTQKPEIAAEIATAALKPGASANGKFAKSIAASLKTIINDTKPVEGGDKDQLTILLTGDQRAKTVGLLKRLAPADIRKALEDTVNNEMKKGGDKPTPQLRTILSAAVDGAFASAAPAPAASTSNAPTATGGTSTATHTASNPTQLIDKVMPADAKGVRNFSMNAAVEALMDPANRKIVRDFSPLIVTTVKETAPQSATLVTERNLNALVNFADSLDKAAKGDTAKKERATKMMQSLTGMISGGNKDALFDGLAPNEIAAFFSDKANREAVDALLNSIEISKLPPKQKQLVETLRDTFGNSNGGMAQVLANEEAVGKLLKGLGNVQVAQSCSAVEKADPVVGLGTVWNPLASSVIQDNYNQINAIARSLARANCLSEGTPIANSSVGLPLVHPSFARSL